MDILTYLQRKWNMNLITVYTNSNCKFWRPHFLGPHVLLTWVWFTSLWSSRSCSQIFWCLPSLCCQTHILISPSCPSPPQFSSPWFSIQLLWIWVKFPSMLPEKRSKKNTLLSVPKPGFTSALSKIHSFISEELLFEPALDLLSKQKLLQPAKFLSESSNTQHWSPAQLTRDWKAQVCRMHLFSPSVLFTFKQTLQPQRQEFV